VASLLQVISSAVTTGSVVLQGQYKSTVMCLKCEKKSVIFEPFVCLPLEIPSPTRCSLAVRPTSQFL